MGTTLEVEDSPGMVWTTICKWLGTGQSGVEESGGGGGVLFKTGVINRFIHHFICVTMQIKQTETREVVAK